MGTKIYISLSYHKFHASNCLGLNLSMKTLREDTAKYNVAWITTLSVIVNARIIDIEIVLYL